RLERAQILRVAHPAAREIPAALGCGAHVSIEFLAALRSEGLTHLVIRAVRLRPGIGPVVPVPIEDRPSLASPHDAEVRLASPRCETLCYLHPESVLSLPLAAV